MKQTTKKTQSLIGFTNMEKIGLATLLVFIVFSPLLFTQIYSGISFIDTGSIGDTIGGITAPFVNLLAAYLVYKSFTAQITANQQQREDHDEQMAIIINEQSINYLLSLFENMEKDYETNEQGHNENGWGNQLVHGFTLLDKSAETPNDYPDHDNDFTTSSSDAFLNNGRIQIQTSIGKVNYIYHNFAMLTDALINSMTKSSDKNLLYVVRYIAFKISNLFKSNNYDFLVDKDIQTYIDNGMIGKKMGEELQYAKNTAELIKSSLLVIMRGTEYMAKAE